MKIAFVTQIIPYPPHGGVLQRGYNLIKQLGQKHSVHLLAYHHPNELPHGEPLERSRTELGRFASAIDYFPVWPKRSTAHKALAFAAAAFVPVPFSVMAHNSRPLAKRLHEICTSQARPDIVHLDTIALAPFARYCGDVPCVLAHHNVESELMRRRAEAERTVLARWYTSAQSRRLRRFEAEQCVRFPRNIVVSANDATTLEGISPNCSTAVAPNGVDTDYFAPTAPTDDPCLIFTGGMNMFANRDGIDWFLKEIWPEILRQVPGARFLAVGQSPTADLLRVVASGAPVEAPGFVPDIRPWVARAAVYVVPLRVGGGTRLKVVDAMAQGKAIVSTSVGAEGISASHGEHLLLADQPLDFANAVVTLLRDRQMRLRIGDAARRTAEQRYSWSLIAADLAATYSEVIRSAA